MGAPIGRTGPARTAPSSPSDPGTGLDRGPAVLLTGTLTGTLGDTLTGTLGDTTAFETPLTDAEAKDLRQALEEGRVDVERIATQWRENKSKVSEKILEMIEQALASLLRFAPLAARSQNGLTDMARQAEQMLRPAAGAVSDVRAALAESDAAPNVVRKRLDALRTQVGRLTLHAHAAAWITERALWRAELDAEPKTEPKTDPKTEAKAEAKAEPKTEAEPAAEPEAEFKGENDTEAGTGTDERETAEAAVRKLRYHISAMDTALSYGTFGLA